MPQRIMLVEDDDDLCFVTQLTLERFGGFEVVVHQTAEDALAAMRFDIPDLVLLDVMLPGMSGMALRLLMSEDPRLADVPVLFLTARVLHRERQELLALKVAGIVAKPFDPHFLVAEVRRALDAAQ